MLREVFFDFGVGVVVWFCLYDEVVDVYELMGNRFFICWVFFWMVFWGLIDCKIFIRFYCWF